MRRFAAISLVFIALTVVRPTARANECFCLIHSTGAILRGCEAYKAATDFYSTAVCTDPETGKRSQQTMYSDWKRIEGGTDRCTPCQRAPQGKADELPRGESFVILTTRNFFGPHDIPPLNFAAYGIVAFPQKFTSETRHRHLSICEAYVATLPPASSSSAPTGDQMVTVWPIDNPSLAERLNQQGESVCKEAVEHYDLNSGLIALKEAATQEKKDLVGQGPYLLGWAPSSQKGKAGSLVLIADLSNATTDEHYREYFQKWRIEIERNPKLWRHGWSLADIQIIIRNWVDKTGTMILSIGHADNKNE